MNTSSQFIVAVHILVIMAVRNLLSNKKQVIKSDIFAFSVNTNPVVIRRCISLLKKAGIVDSQSGPNGGAVLKTSCDDISLADVYKAVETGELFHMHYGGPNPKCAIGSNIQDSLSGILQKAKNAVTDTLKMKTIHDIATDIMSRSVIAEKLASGITPQQLDEMIGQEFDKYLKK